MSNGAQAAQRISLFVARLQPSPASRDTRVRQLADEVMLEPDNYTMFAARRYENG